MAIHRNRREIPIPADAHINNNDGRVFIYTTPGAIRRESKRKVIGLATSSATMIPNDNFREMFPGLWEEYYGEDTGRRKVLSSGLFALMLGAGYSTGAYQALLDTVGPADANGIMDYASYLIGAGSNAAMNYSSAMAGSVTFSDRPLDDDYFCDLFSSKLPEEAMYRFRDAMMRKCRDMGTGKVWIAIDGSNIDCCSDGVDLAEKGHAKSGSDSDIVSFMYAVDAGTGRPITFFVYEGGKVDCKAMDLVVSYLSDSGLEIQGFILDRGFCYRDCLERISSLGKQYVVMLKSNTKGHADMVEKHGGEIRWNGERLVSLDGIFGVSEYGPVFSDGAPMAYLNLFYSAQNGCDRSLRLMEKVKKEIERLERVRDRGDGELEVASGLDRYVRMTVEDGKATFAPVVKEIFSSISAKGFYTIASSSDLGPAEVDRSYNLRNAPESLYAAMKTQLGGKTMRVHSTESMKGRHMAYFVALLLRWAVMDSCRRSDLRTNEMVHEMKRIQMLRQNNGDYTAIHSETERQKKLLSCFDILPGDFDMLAQMVNERSKPVHHIEVAKPEHEPVVVRKKPGRKKGVKTGPRKNKKAYVVGGKVLTEEEYDALRSGKEAAKAPDAKASGTSAADAVKPEPEKEFPRENTDAKGEENANAKAKTKDATKKATGKKAQKAKAEEPEEPKRKPGRPKGSKNKPKPGQKVWVVRKPGRPKGSKDKRPRKKRGSDNGPKNT